MKLTHDEVMEKPEKRVVSSKDLKAFRKALDETTIETPSKTIPTVIDKHLVGLVEYANRLEDIINKQYRELRNLRG